LGGASRSNKKDPNVADFGIETAAEILDNRRFLFKNTRNAWDGVEPFTCPTGLHRRLFHVVFEHVDRPPEARRGSRPLFRFR